VSQALIDIGWTDAYAADQVRRRMYGWPMLVAAAAMLGPGAALFARGKPLPLLVGILVLLGIVSVLRAYRRHLVDETRNAGAAVADALSVELVGSLRGKRMIDAGDLFAAACRSARGKSLLSGMGIDPQALSQRCEAGVREDVDAASFLSAAIAEEQPNRETRITSTVVLSLLLRDYPGCMQVLRETDLAKEDLPALLHWEHMRHDLAQKLPPFSAAALAKSGSLGRTWVMGYTDDLDRLTDDLADRVRLEGERSVMIRAAELENALRALGRETQKNVLVIGAVGAGKRTLVENAAALLRKNEKAAHSSFTRVLQLKTQDLLSGTADPDAFFLQALNRAKDSGRFILVIRELSLFLGAGNPALKGVLLKFLETKNITIIGIADAQEYRDLVRSDPSLDNLFDKIELGDATDAETMAVLMARSLEIERKRRIAVTYKALKQIPDLAKRYLAAKGALPGKALQVLEDAALRCAETGAKVLTEEHVREVVSARGRVDVRSVGGEEKNRLLELETTLKKRVIGQDAAIRAVSSALKRARLDLRERAKPMGTFLFLGPTGVGKSQTAKALAEEYFGSADAFVRLDMNEFSHPDSVFGIVGAASGASGSGGEGFLARRVQDRPFSLVLLDEIEKAHPTVLNLFLQILDEGFLTDQRGTRTDFRNTIIIATSNAGALYLRDTIKEKGEVPPDELRRLLLDYVLRERLFTPEFVNRFDEVVLFYPLTASSAHDVAGLMLREIIRDVRDRRGIEIVIDDDVVDGLAQRGQSVEFGAREMRRTITDIIEDYLADYFLRNDAKRGDTIRITKAELKW
jgi:ATP-dependent Clp protease ATP-binding subunit ClpC